MSEVIRFPLPWSPPARPVKCRTSDEVLMLRFQALTDYAAFDRLFRCHKDPFASFLLRLSGNTTVAGQLSQRAWLRIIASADGGELPRVSAFRTRLYALGCDLYADEHARTDAFRRGTELGLPPVQRALMALSLVEREIVALWSGGFSVRAIGDVTGWETDVVLAIKRRALGSLAGLLAERMAGASMP